VERWCFFFLFLRVVVSNEVSNSIYETGVSYKAPLNLTYFWNFGVYSLVALFVQIVTGLFLAMHYIPSVDLAFISVELIMREVNNGWLIRYLHSNGASLFFLVVYVHIFRGMYFSSFTFPRILIWFVGLLILFLMIVIAFLGYVLPWGQMSFWGATVITNLFSAFPYFGSDVVVWLWGGFSVGAATLLRFYSLHFFLPFVLVFLVGLHLVFLHLEGSSSPLGFSKFYSFLVFSPYYIVKDLFGVVIYFLCFLCLVCFYPNVLGHTDNYIVANPLVTPAHIVPEWYFLPFLCDFAINTEQIIRGVGLIFVYF
jgi:ubiquinol-cytochrome c reductase cytochrome b/c1 subunit